MIRDLRASHNLADIFKIFPFKATNKNSMEIRRRHTKINEVKKVFHRKSHKVNSKPLNQALPNTTFIHSSTGLQFMNLHSGKQCQYLLSLLFSNHISLFIQRRERERETDLPLVDSFPKSYKGRARSGGSQELETPPGNPTRVQGLKNQCHALLASRVHSQGLDCSFIAGSSACCATKLAPSAAI